MKKHVFLAFAAIALLCTACNGIFPWIYSPAPPKTGFGFVETDESTHSGTIFIDATDYAKWTYINFAKKTIDTSNIRMEEPEPANWDFAIHRYDVKTNNGAALQTEHFSLHVFKGNGVSLSGDFSPDTLSRVAYDMSGMMDNNVLYTDSHLNKVLCKWLDVNTSQMPPIYTLSNRVYILRLSNGQYAALLFTNYMNSASVKGYVTIRYVFPVKVNVLQP